MPGPHPDGPAAGGDQPGQSPASSRNTSLVFDDAAILKVFRRVYPGRNPDIEVHRALSELDGGARHVARLLGHVEARWAGPDGSLAEADLAMLQEFFRTATDGWELAKISVRDLYAEADLHAYEVGGDFAGEAYRLGEATAEVHADLARALPTGVLDAGRRWPRRPAQMQRRLDAALAAVPELADYAAGLRDGVPGARPRTSPACRCSGCTATTTSARCCAPRTAGWCSTSRASRPSRCPSGPGSTRRCATWPACCARSTTRPGTCSPTTRSSRTWPTARTSGRPATGTRSCDGYAEAGGPDPREDPVLLRAYEADKAVYEVVYEARNRPSWLPIPLASLARLTEGARS